MSSWLKDYSRLRRKPKQNFTNTSSPGKRAVEGAHHCHQPLFSCLSYTSQPPEKHLCSCERGCAVNQIRQLVWVRQRQTQRCFSIWVTSPACFRSQPYYSCLSMTEKLLNSSTRKRRSGRAQGQGQEQLQMFFPSKTLVTTPHPHEKHLKHPVLTLTWVPPSTTSAYRNLFKHITGTGKYYSQVIHDDISFSASYSIISFIREH